MIISVFDRKENIVGKGENAGYQHFRLFQNVFKCSVLGSLKLGIVWKRVNESSSAQHYFSHIRPTGYIMHVLGFTSI